MIHLSLFTSHNLALKNLALELVVLNIWRCLYIVKIDSVSLPHMRICAMRPVVYFLYEHSFTSMLCILVSL